MRKYLSGRSERPWLAVAGTVLCLVLLVLLTVVQVAHIHPSQSDADHCPICIVLHAVAPVAATAVAIILVQLGVSVPPAEAPHLVRYWHPSLFTRPPPFAG